MQYPMFSIVIACYNQRHFVRAAVESALSQRTASKEVIVVDDASSDGTREILETFGSSIRLVALARNQGAIAARNHGSSLATGQYLVFLDGDDVLMPRALEVYQRVIALQMPKVILGRRSYFRGDLPSAGECPARIEFVSYGCWFEKDREASVGASNCVVHRETFWTVGGWSPGIFHLDVADFLVKLGLAGTTVLILSPATAWYRIHDANVTRAVLSCMRCGHVIVRKERAGGYPGGRRYRFARYTCLGGPILYWSRRGMAAGHYVEATKLAGSAWFPILVALVRRAVSVCRGRRPVQSMEFRSGRVAESSRPYEYVEVGSRAIRRQSFHEVASDFAEQGGSADPSAT